jgi:DNA polymerase-3 subunit epsilon
MLAREVHPGARVSLDALCKHYGIDNSRRTLHGALLDSEILAEVYLELIGGRQVALALVSETRISTVDAIASLPVARQRPEPLPPRLTDAERQAHEALLRTLGADALWGVYREPEDAVA